MNKNVILAILVLAVIGIGTYALMNRGAPSETTNNTVNEETNTSQPTESDTTAQESSKLSTLEATNETTKEAGEVKEFEVSGANFRFNPSSITVNKGDTVRIIFSNTDESMMHDWVVDEFNAKTQVLKPGASETIEFVADQTGEFEFYCSVGQHRANGMVGTLTVQ